MNILEYLKDHLMLLDGGMGTLLQARGLEAGELPERWNLSHPIDICEIHRAYFDAGSQIVMTNTFGANSLRFSADELESIIAAAVQNARKAQAESTRPGEKWVALDIGPTGKMLAPYGDFEFEEAVSTFAETVRIGARCGVDLIFIETMNDSFETKAALLAAKENSSLPVFVSNAYGEDGKLMTGADPEAMVALLEGMGADAIGVNCSFGPKTLAPVVEKYLQTASVPVFFKPNAGLPKAVNGKTVYDVSPEEFAEDVTALIRKGVRLAGGCCGTTPAYLAALAEKSADVVPPVLEEKAFPCVSSYTHAVRFEKKAVLIGERINPTGKKRLKEALRAGDMAYVLQEGLAQQEKGVDLLDVNVGLPEICEPEMLRRAVFELQAVIDLPLQIDTADIDAMEAALRIYNGKAMVNSVNGKKESMDAVFPLVKKYGGLVVALTLDENGIPETAEGRLAIAEKILHEASRYGLKAKDLIFDPLAMAISADPNAAGETLRAVKLIREQLGCKTSLGVSNVSFGLPQRDAISSAFFTLALENGLDAAIINPNSVEMNKAYRAFYALRGQDENFADYIAFAESMPTVNAGSAPAPAAALKSDEENRSALQRAIMKGLKDLASATAEELLLHTAPLTLVQEEIIPALNTVGKGFEEKTIYLPQLLMSAEAAKAAFEAVKKALSGGTSASRCPFVLATVKGDIHDIGKNIVKLLLENYGFAVTDLGRDVAPEKIVEATVALHAPVVGLSALMTTTVAAMEETIVQLRKAAPWCKIVVGGAVLNREYADAIGADFWSRDAMETVRYAEMIEKNLSENPTC